MSDSIDDKSPSRRTIPSEDSKSSNNQVDVDPSDESADSSVKPEAKDAPKDKPADSSVQPSCSYGGARPKVYPTKKEGKTKKTSDVPRSIDSTVQRAVEVLEATVSRQREIFRRRREEAKKAEKPVSGYLGPGWIDAATEEKKPPVSPCTLRLRCLAREILESEFERRRMYGREDFKAWIPVAVGGAEPPPKKPLSAEPCEKKFEEDFKEQSDSDDPPRMNIKLPDLAKKPSPKPKDKDSPVEEPLPQEEHHDEYHVKSLSMHMFVDRSPFILPEFENELSPLYTYHWLDAIFVQHGIEDWRRFALAAYQTGRYHTEQQLQVAREFMEELNVSNKEFLEMYHLVRREYEMDEGSSYEFSNVVERILTLLDSMELITTAMLYMDIWLSWMREEEAKQKEKVAKLLKATKSMKVQWIDNVASFETVDDDQETDPSDSTEHSVNRSDSDIVEDYSSKSEEKTPPFFYETLKEYVTIEIDYEPHHLTLEDRPPSVLSSSDKSSTPIPPSPAEIASPSPEAIASPNVVTPTTDDSEKGLKMQIYEMAPAKQATIESSSSSLPSSKKILKLSYDKSLDSSSSSLLSSIKLPQITRLQEMDSPDNTSGSVSPLPLDSPNVQELEDDTCEIDVERFHIVPHVIVTRIIQNVMNAAREKLVAISQSNEGIENVVEPKDEGMETDSASQSSEENQSTNSEGKRKEHQIDSDDESSKKMPKKRHVE